MCGGIVVDPPGWVRIVILMSNRDKTFTDILTLIAEIVAETMECKDPDSSDGLCATHCELQLDEVLYTQEGWNEMEAPEGTAAIIAASIAMYKNVAE